MLDYSDVHVARADLTTAARYMFWLMFRNVASDGLVFDDPVNAGIISSPGCVLASPSWENTATHVTQDYVYHWTRDAAIVALELSAAYASGVLPDSQPLNDYVRFSQTCQQSQGDFDRASFYIDGAQRPWTDQTDGPALQTVALLTMYGQLDASAQATAASLIGGNLDFLAGAYQGQTYNLWEEEYGYSFFARSAQLRCFQAVAANTDGIAVPGWLPAAMTWLTSALDGHWNGEYYRSVLPVPTDYRAPYDPNIDIAAVRDLRRRVGHRPPAARHRRPAARPVGRPGLGVLLPGQRRRRRPRHRPAARPLPWRRLRRRHRRADRRPSVGCDHSQLRGALLPSRCQNPFIPNGPGRLPVRPLPHPGRDHRDDGLATGRGRRAARGRGQHAAGHRVPQ